MTTPFSLTDPLPTGTLVLEASAGTGKTYAITALAVRFIADGTPVSRLLMATFSNAASTELRDRTRIRLRECALALTDPARARTSDDELVALLATGTEDEVSLRRVRLLAALSDFDSATMATTHTFCNRMLTVLGFLGERDQHYQLVEDANDMARETARDLFVAKYAGEPDSDASLGTAEVVACEAVRNSSTRLAPLDPQSESGVSWVRFAKAVRERVRIRKRWSRLRTYDDLQGRLYEIISDQEWGAAACTRIRDRFEVVLVDEFQDTDPEQWEILQRCFHGHRPLVLVGDPKQSIYAFRGADVFSYLQASRQAQEQRNLTVNWRSDGPLVNALGKVFVDAELGDPAIVVRPVDARGSEPRILNAAPLRLRFFNRRDFVKHTRDGSTPLVPGVRDRVIADVAADIAATLAGNARLIVDDGPGQIVRRVEPGDIAVLLRANATIAPLQRALAAHGIATVVTGGQSVFASDAARYWWYVLQALDRPSDSRRVRSAATTPLIGVTPAELDARGDAGVGSLAGALSAWARTFDDAGAAAMTGQLLRERHVAQRVLKLADGERLLTDLLQVASLMAEEVAHTGCGLSGLATWLGESVADGQAVQRRANQTRRLDRDTAAVQLMTVHASKGLEFPIVYVPFGWDGGRPSRPKTFTYHEGGVRYLDVGGEHAGGYHERKRIADAETAGEELRLLYVALTRARSQVVAWWAPSTTTSSGAMHRILFTAVERMAAMRAGTRLPIRDSIALLDDAREETELTVVADFDEGISLEHAGQHGHVPQWHPSVPGGAGAPGMVAASFDRAIDGDYRRSSYSSIVRAAHEAAHAASGPEPTVGTEPEDEVVREGELLDEPADDVDATAEAEGASAGSPSLMNGLPFGARFGTLVHEVLEYVDTGVADRTAHIRELCVAGAARTAFDIDVDVLAVALEGVLTTPIGLVDDGPDDLWSIRGEDRLSEMEFELPLAGVDGGFDLASVAELMHRHLADDDPLRPYADEVATVSDEKFHGFLTGSIDSVLRVAGDEGPRFVVVDYKTNRIQPGDLVAETFSREAMAQEMMTAHYPLQALLYSVALHRYLRWRLPGYTPERNLGAVQYQFVRGMVGPGTPGGCGVFQWEIPPGLVVDLSDLLAGVRR